MGVDKQKKTPRTRDGNDNASSSHPAAFAQSPRKSSTVPMFYVLARSSKERRRGGGGNLAKFHLVRRVCVTRPFFLPLLFHSQFFVAVLAIESRGSKAFAFQRFDLHSKHVDSTRKSESISALFRDPERELNKESDVFISLIYKARWNGMEYIQVNGKWSELDFRISLASFFFFCLEMCFTLERD